MRRLALALTCAVALAGPGCFALEEIDQGQEIMDEHFGGERKAKAQAEEEAREQAAREKDGDEGLWARARGWWDGGGEGEDGAEPAPSGPPPHPDNVVGRCELDGSTQFMRKFDCQLRGGRYVPTESSAAR